MGSRANYVVVEGGVWRLFHSHWGARSLETDLLAGPESALRFIRAQRAEEEPGAWLDDTWCEAAALVDRDRRALVLFTLHLEGYEHRAALREVLGETWPGWRVCWAYDGLADLAAYVGLPRSLVRAESSPDPPEAAVDHVECLLTVADGERVRAYPLRACSVQEAVARGPGLLGALPAGAERADCPVFPDAGVHLDLPSRTAGAWTADTLDGALEHTASRWRGWRWAFWADRYDRQAALAGDAVRLPALSPDSGFGAIVNGLDRRAEDDPAGSARRFVDRLSAHETGVRPSSSLFDHRVVPPAAAEQAALEAAVRRCAARRHTCSRPPSWCSASASSSSNHLPFSPR